MAQERTTNETKIVVVIDADNHKVSHLELLNKIQNQTKEELFKKYPKHTFFYGVLRGKFELSKEEVLPKTGATIIVLTGQQLFTEDRFYADKKILTGDWYSLGKTKTQVIKKKKGELFLLAQ